MGYNTPMKRIHLLLPQPLLDRVKALSERTGLSASDLIRRAIEAYLKGEGA